MIKNTQYIVKLAIGETRYYKDENHTILHREDGPAIEHPSGNHKYFFNNVMLTHERWLEVITPKQTFANGSLVSFALRDGNFDNMLSIALAVNGDVCTIVALATAHELGNKNMEYYDIRFDYDYGSITMNAVSGYHLFNVK